MISFSLPMRAGTVSALAFSALLPAVEPAFPQEREAYFRNEARSRGVTGTETSDTRLAGFPQTEDVALYGITYGERGDHPCFLQAHGESLNSIATDFEDFEDKCGPKGPRDRSILFAGWEDGRSLQVGSSEQEDSDGVFTESLDRYFVHGIQGCFNRDKLKGIRVESIKLSDELTLQDPAPEVNFEIVGAPGIYYGQESLVNTTFAYAHSENCKSNDWANMVRCGPRQVAVAIGIHYERGKEPENITGLELWCRRVWVRVTGTIEMEIQGEIRDPSRGR